MTEILAPAGSMQSLRAACANGANAVYLGGELFSARAFADNFSKEQLAEAIELAHFYGVRVYLAVNTLLTDEELKQALVYIAFACKSGIDALIVQDWGLLAALRRAIPDLSIHASTQMTVHNLAGAQMLAKTGVRRVILARELSLQEIKFIKDKTDTELEVFIHGALCISYSGQCLMSSMIGGRSGNRGRCAQPCRLEYDFLDAEQNKVQNTVAGKYLLSPRDIYGYEVLEDVAALDLAAWKIEGRMKRPEYVATVTRIYAEAQRDILAGKWQEQDHAKDLSELIQVFNRDHNCGYFSGNPGVSLMSYQRPNNRGTFLGRILSATPNSATITLEQNLLVGDGLEIWVKVGGRQGFIVEHMQKEGQPVQSAQAGDTVTVDCLGAHIGDRVFKTYDQKLAQKAQASYEELKQFAVDLTVTAKIDEPLQLSAVCEDGFSAQVLSDYVVVVAKTAPATKESIEAQLSRLGGSGYYLRDLHLQIEANCMLPASVLNHGRRDMIEQLRAQRLACFTKSEPDYVQLNQIKKELSVTSNPKKNQPSRQCRFAVMVEREEAALAAAEAGANEIYFSADSFAPYSKNPDWQVLKKRLEAKGCGLVACLPKILHDGDLPYWQKQVGRWQKAEVEAVLIGNFSELALLRKMNWRGKRYVDSGFNIFNSSSLRYFAAQGLDRVTLSPELNLDELKQIAAATADIHVEKEWLAHGAQELMVSRYCALGALCGGKDLDRACTKPCLKSGVYNLRDQKNYIFPCRFDRFCRMHIFNSRPLCLAADLLTLSAIGLDLLRLDLRLYEPNETEKIMALYRRAAYLKEGKEESSLQQEIKAMIGEYTKGHLYRGV